MAFSGLVALLMLAAAATGSPLQDTAKDATKAAEQKELWWQHAVIYQIYPRSFKDSNGDGIGDMKGITWGLDYLKELGVTAVWISPFYPSPQADFGYDITDYRNVDPTYGTIDDFKAMLKRAHELGLKIVIDLVPNHSSDEHEWFKKSVNKEGKYKDYYVWSPGKVVNGKRVPPNNWVSRFRQSAWKWNEKRGEYYLHQFNVKQADLNYRSQDVVDEIKDLFKYWMELGVDGFRIDALPWLFETADLTKDEPRAKNVSPNVDDQDWYYYNHTLTFDLPETYDMLRQWREVVDSFPDNKTRAIMSECYTDFNKTIEYYGTKERPAAHFTFNFEFVSKIDDYSYKINASSTASDFKTTIDRWMGAMEGWRSPNWVIGNHDNPRVATRYPGMADAMNMIFMTLPGTFVTYQGEELGMTNTFVTWKEGKDPFALNAGESKFQQLTRDPQRTSMQWDDTTSAGFSANVTTWLPINPNYYRINVKTQKAKPNSHLRVYKDLMAARQTETLKKGSLQTAIMKDDVLVITRSYEGHETYVTLANIGSYEKTIESKDLPTGLRVYTAGENSHLSKGSPVPSTFKLRPKQGIVLTTAPWLQDAQH